MIYPDWQLWNYISLCVLSKILENIIFDQAQEYLTSNKILYGFQSGFRQRFSTDTCLIHLSNSCPSVSGIVFWTVVLCLWPGTTVQNTIPSTSGQQFDCSQITYEITLLPLWVNQLFSILRILIHKHQFKTLSPPPRANSLTVPKSHMK